jgi:hypothetical protein
VWPSQNPVKILQCFLTGGVSFWETFWVTQKVSGGPDWRNFDAAVQSLIWRCAPDSVAANQPELVQSFATAGGTPVFWGPATKPLWRPDILPRARLVAERHGAAPHQVAGALGLTGFTLGRTTASGLGAKIAHRAMDLVKSPTPYSYVLVPPSSGGLFNFVPAAAANGRHPAYAQPLTIKVGDPLLASLLPRANMTPEADELTRSYQALAREHLRYHAGDLVRSAGFRSYDAAVDFLVNAKLLAQYITPQLLQVSPGPTCGVAPARQSPTMLDNPTKTSLELATKLLTAGGARCVCVFDAGLWWNYDTHVGPDDHITITSSNILNFCAALASQIDPTGGGNPSLLNLNDTMIVIQSEFGRTPYVDTSLGGRDHWPAGFPALLIGGPITPSLGMTIGGSIDAAGIGQNAFSPTDLHAAVLLAAGVNPFAPGNLVVDDLTAPSIYDSNDPNQPNATMINLKTKVLGVP